MPLRGCPRTAVTLCVWKHLRNPLKGPGAYSLLMIHPPPRRKPENLFGQRQFHAGEIGLGPPFQEPPRPHRTQYRSSLLRRFLSTQTATQARTARSLSPRLARLSCRSLCALVSVVFGSWALSWSVANWLLTLQLEDRRSAKDPQGVMSWQGAARQAYMSETLPGCDAVRQCSDLRRAESRRRHRAANPVGPHGIPRRRVYAERLRTRVLADQGHRPIRVHAAIAVSAWKWTPVYQYARVGCLPLSAW